MRAWIFFHPRMEFHGQAPRAARRPFTPPCKAVRRGQKVQKNVRRQGRSLLRTFLLRNTM